MSCAVNVFYIEGTLLCPLNSTFGTFQLEIAFLFNIFIFPNTVHIAQHHCYDLIISRKKKGGGG